MLAVESHWAGAEPDQSAAIHIKLHTKNEARGAFHPAPIGLGFGIVLRLQHPPVLKIVFAALESALVDHLVHAVESEGNQMKLPNDRFIGIALRSNFAL